MLNEVSRAIVLETQGGMPPWLVVPVPRKLGKFGKLFTDSSLLQLPAEQLPAGPSNFFLSMYICTYS